MSSKEIQFHGMLETNNISCPLIFAVVSGLLFFPSLGTRDFWAPGELICGEVIRVMFDKNSWIATTLNGQLSADKPILYFWLALASSKLAGAVGERKWYLIRVPRVAS